MDTAARTAPARGFALRTLAVVLALGIAVSLAVAHSVRAAGRAQMTFHAAFVVDHLVEPRLAGGVPPATVLNEVARLDPQVRSLSLLGPAREVLTTTTATPGATTGAATTTTRDEVTLRDGRTVVVEQDGSAVAATTAALTRRIAGFVLLGLAAMWAVVVPLARRLGDRLTTQYETLEAQGVELQRLLAGEQETVRRLREYDRLREQFLTSVSHELRTPLTVVAGVLHTLTEQPDAIGDDLRSRLLVRARHHAGRLDALVADLLTLAGRGPGPVHDHELVDVREAVAAARQELPSCRVDLDLEVDRLWTERQRFVQSVTALLGNAARHGPSDEPVVVRTRSHGADVEVVVDDRGPGIPAGDRGAAFEPFWQGDLRDGHSPGTGIGLALVAAHATTHGGRAWAEQRPGGGARIRVLLPGALARDVDRAA